MISAPAYLDSWPDAQRAFTRIVDKLLARGQWDSLYLSSAAAASTCVAAYRRACEAYGPQDPTTLESRTVAVEWLTSMQFLEHAVTPLDSEGRDLTLLELCE